MKPAVYALVLSFFLFACGTEENPHGVGKSATGCDPHTAAIAVFDGKLKALCGCSETATQSEKGPGETFKCTVTKDDSVHFYFPTNLTAHQIVPVGLPAITAGPFIDVGSPPDAYGLKLTATGSYIFQDRFLPELKGTIVVNP